MHGSWADSNSGSLIIGGSFCAGMRLRWVFTSVTNGASLSFWLKFLNGALGNKSLVSFFSAQKLD